MGRPNSSASGWAAAGGGCVLESLLAVVGVLPSILGSVQQGGRQRTALLPRPHPSRTHLPRELTGQGRDSARSSEES